MMIGRSQPEKLTARTWICIYKMSGSSSKFQQHFSPNQFISNILAATLTQQFSSVTTGIGRLYRWQVGGLRLKVVFQQGSRQVLNLSEESGLSLQRRHVGTLYPQKMPIKDLTRQHNTILNNPKSKPAFSETKPAINYQPQKYCVKLR